MTVMHVVGILGCLKAGRPVAIYQVKEVVRALEHNHSLRTKVAQSYGCSVEEVARVLDRGLESKLRTKNRR